MSVHRIFLKRCGFEPAVHVYPKDTLWTTAQGDSFFPPCPHTPCMCSRPSRAHQGGAAPSHDSRHDASARADGGASPHRYTFTCKYWQGLSSHTHLISYSSFSSRTHLTLIFLFPTRPTHSEAGATAPQSPALAPVVPRPSDPPGPWGLRPPVLARLEPGQTSTISSPPGRLMRFVLVGAVGGLRFGNFLR
jgi:hypothetical protein